MMKSEFLFVGFLRQAYKLPRVAREAPINVGQLLMLCAIAHAKGLTRADLLYLETHEKPTVDKRIQYLEKKGLIKRNYKSHYHAMSEYTCTKDGKALYMALRGKKPHNAVVVALENAIDLPIENREEPINVRQLIALQAICSEPNIDTTHLLQQTSETKPTLHSRLKYLQKKGLIKKYPEFNAGGSGSPNYYRSTNRGQTLIKLFS